MILIFSIFYELFYDFKRRIRCFKTILIILNPNFSKKRKKKKGQNPAFQLITRKAFARLFYIDLKIYVVNGFLCTPTALQVICPGNKTVSRKNLPVSNLYNRRLHYYWSMFWRNLQVNDGNIEHFFISILMIFIDVVFLCRCTYAIM